MFKRSSLPGIALPWGCIEENKFCSNAMIKHFNKELVTTKKDNEEFENSTKCLICNSGHVDGEVNV